MKLTARSRYAVTALADIATEQAGGPVAVADIVDRQKIPHSFLDQLFRKLKAAGLVKAQRGVSGGYRLGLPADAIRIADIVRAVDEQIQSTACKPGQGVGCLVHGVRCLTHDLWDELDRQIESFMGSVTLEDVVERRIAARTGQNMEVAE